MSQPQEKVKKSSTDLAECAKLADVDSNRDPKEAARIAKLEAIERQLYHLIGQVRNLKTI